MITSLLNSGLSGKEMVLHLMCMLFAITISFSVHEFMHARTAVWLGDDTPAHMGRLTLNPLAHLDPMGTVLILIAGFGWGKPVMYNPNNLKRFKSDRIMNIMVHLAGVTGNLIVGLIASAFLGVFTILNARFDHVIFMTMTMLFAYIVMFSLGLLAFNLLPIPPLDGFHVFEELLPYKVKMSNGYMQFQRMAPLILMIVFVASSFGRIPILSNLIDIIETPFSFLCNLVAELFVYLTSLVV